MLGVKQKAIITLVVLGMNLLVLLIMPWFLVISAIPSLLFVGAVLTR